MADVTPHHLEAERAVLGAILVNNPAYFEIADRIGAEDFFRHAHQHIWRVMAELLAAGEPVDVLTLAQRLEARGQLESVGGKVYLYRLPDGVPKSANALAYAGIVAEHAQRARLIQVAQRILRDTDDAVRSSRELVDDAERLIFALSQRDVRGDFVDAATLVQEGYQAIGALLERKQGITGVASGFTDLDRITRGLQPGSLVILAARPSMGKTALALNIAWNVVSTGRKAGLFSLEMSRQELFMRLMASVSRIDSHRLQSGYVHQSDYDRMTRTFSEIGDSGLFVDDSAVVTALDVRAKARRLKSGRGLDLLVVDYLQLMQTPRAESHNLAIAEISRSLKLVARELNIPVLALSQLSRGVESRSEKRPMLSDLRDSGALEQDADLVLFLYRDEVYRKTPENAGLAEVIIAKHRNGATGMVELRWADAETRFDNLQN